MATHPITIESAGGEYMESVLILAWAARPGDRVKTGDLLVTVETAKAATEIEADRDGWLAEILFPEGTEAPVGAVLGTLSDTRTDVAGEAADAAAAVADENACASQAGAVSSGNASGSQAQRVVASPLARRIARAEGLDLSGVHGTGPHGRIKQRDVKAALAERARTASRPVQETRGAHPAASVSPARQSRQADPVLLLHGFAADRTAWRQVLPLLPADMETVALDLPGHGSEAASPAASIEDLALALSDRLDALGIARAHLVGHSLGGAAALQLAAIGRVAVRSMTLFAPGGLGPDIHGGFIVGLTGSANAEALDQWLGFMVANRSALPDGYAAAAYRQLQRAGNAATLRLMADSLFPGGTQGFNLGEALAALNVPTRLVWGRADRVASSSHAAMAPGFVAVHMLDGVGHVPQLEVPALAARLIAETVRSAGP